MMPKLLCKSLSRINVSHHHSMDVGCTADTKHLTVISLRIRRFTVSDKTLLAFRSNFASKRVTRNVTLLFVLCNETALKFSYTPMLNFFY